MLLGLKTDAPVIEVYLYNSSGEVVASTTIETNRTLARRLLSILQDFVSEQKTSLANLDGLFAYAGPGSFTGLRIGLTVMNTLAYAEGIPIVGATGPDWAEVAVSRLLNSENDQVVLPEYGAEARITTPKK